MNREAITCDRCGRGIRDHRDEVRWNVTMRRGVVAGFLCPDCQTVDENAEAEINLATTNYSIDAFGRAIGTPKLDDENPCKGMTPEEARADADEFNAAVQAIIAALDEAGVDTLGELFDKRRAEGEQ